MSLLVDKLSDRFLFPFAVGLARRSLMYLPMLQYSAIGSWFAVAMTFC
ncbi:hypothetical protein [Tumidithrix helvetica]